MEGKPQKQLLGLCVSEVAPGGAPGPLGTWWGHHGAGPGWPRGENGTTAARLRVGITSWSRPPASCLRCSHTIFSPLPGFELILGVFTEKKVSPSPLMQVSGEDGAVGLCWVPPAARPSMRPAELLLEAQGHT